MEFLVQDVIETAFLSLVIDKNPAVVIHGAKTKLKERGYGDRLELEHSGNLGVVFNIVEKSVEEIKNARPNNNTQAEGNPTSP